MKYNANKKEVFKMIMDLEIEKLNKALDLVDDVEKVIADYDGMVINKNLENRLKKIDADIRLEKKDYFNYSIVYVKINFYNNRSVTYEGRSYYSDLNELYFNTYTKTDDITTDGKRLNAEEFLKYFKDTRKRIKNMIASRQEAKRDFDKTFKEYKEMQEKIDTFNKELNTNINQYFDLRFKG